MFYRPSHRFGRAGSVASALLLGIMAVALTGCGEEPTPPRLVGFNPAIVSVPAHGSIDVEILYEPGSFEPNDFQWTAEAGEIEGNGQPAITYRAPEEAGDYQLAVTVAYGEEGADVTLDTVVKVTPVEPTVAATTEAEPDDTASETAATTDDTATTSATPAREPVETAAAPPAADELAEEATGTIEGTIDTAIADSDEAAQEAAAEAEDSANEATAATTATPEGSESERATETALTATTEASEATAAAVDEATDTVATTAEEATAEGEEAAAAATEDAATAVTAEEAPDATAAAVEEATDTATATAEAAAGEADETVTAVAKPVEEPTADTIAAAEDAGETAEEATEEAAALGEEASATAAASAMTEMSEEAEDTGAAVEEATGTASTTAEAAAEETTAVVEEAAEPSVAAADEAATTATEGATETAEAGAATTAAALASSEPAAGATEGESADAVAALEPDAGDTGEAPEAAVAVVTEPGAESRVDQILERKRLNAVVQIRFEPFSFYDEDGRRVGFEIDILREFARRWVDDPKAVTFLPVPTDARIPTLEKGRADLIAAAMTKTPERARQVEFSLTYFKDGQRLLVPEGSPVVDVCDLRGRRVAATQGSTSLDNLMGKASECGFELGDDLVVVRRHEDALEALLAGRVEAFTSDGIALENYAENQPLEVVGNHFSEEPYGLAAPRGDTKLRDLIDATLLEMEADGTFAAIFERWFGDEIRPLPLERDAEPEATEVAALTTTEAPAIIEPRRAPLETASEYEVQPGDTLSKIAGKVYGDVSPGSWERIFEANRDQIGDDPSRIEVGMLLTIPQ